MFETRILLEVEKIHSNLLVKYLSDATSINNEKSSQASFFAVIWPANRGFLEALFVIKLYQSDSVYHCCGSEIVVGIFST